MAQESVTIESANHPPAIGQADDVVRHSTAVRIIMASMWAVGGFLLAAPCILIPVVHLVSTWGLPLLGILMGLRAWKRRVVIHNITGTCPACQQQIQLNGGSIDDMSWQVCPVCKAALKVRPSIQDDK